ncbi:MAG TPA: radical SAM protein, partial [Kiritimatiellae bacterium]|nr:radical SAM protein [Kiritimatiellia bacterium]
PTNRCNLRCIHCYASAGAALPKEMGLPQWKRTIDQLLAEGYRHFTLCGGEPFMYPHLKELLQHLAACGAETIAVLTNAAVLREDTVRYAAEIKVEFGVTFYSHLREHHEKITRVRGSWRAALDGMNLLLRLGIPFSVNIPLGSVNQDDLEETLDFLERLGVPRHRAGGNIVYPLGRGCNPEVLPARRTVFNIRTEVYEIAAEDGRLDYHTCWRGKLLVMADGRVTPCPSARDDRFVIGSLTERSLSELLADARLHRLWAVTLDNVPECRECELRYGCHDCRANAFIYTGELLGKNPYCSYEPRTGSWKAPALPEQPTRQVERTPGFSLRFSADGSAVLNDEKSGGLFMINPTAGLIFKALDQPRALEELAQILCERFDVSPSRAYRDVSRIVWRAVKAGILRWL